MRKILLALVAGVTLSVNAQLTVVNNNHVEIGTPSSSLISPFSSNVQNGANAIINPTTKVETDSLATMTLLGTQSQNRGAYITFGGNRGIAVGDYYRNGNTRVMLELTGRQGITYLAGDDQPVFYYNWISSSVEKPFYFYCPVVANGVTLSSDSRLKSDVKSLDDTFSRLYDLNSVSYKIGAQSIAKDLQTSGKAVKNAGTDSRVQYGYIAQEVKELFPDLVVEDENGYLSVDYIGLIPLLVDAVKDLNAKIEVLEGKDGDAPRFLAPSATGVDEIEAVTNSLSQNKPNPFSATTLIECTLKEDVKNAMIGIYDLQGKQVRMLTVEGRGKTSVTVDGSTLAPGIYIYALIADGAEIATKRMIITD